MRSPSVEERGVVSTWLPLEQRAALERIARDEDRTLSWVVRRCVAEHLATRSEEEHDETQFDAVQ
jgi:hypothetical protein